jgi:ubiquitin carboxyl-terminal hydrolase 48
VHRAALFNHFLHAFQTNGLAMISEFDWELFSKEYSAGSGKGIAAEIAFSNSSQDKLQGSLEATPMTNGDLDRSLDDSNDDLQSREPYVKTDPEVNCTGARCYCIRILV